MEKTFEFNKGILTINGFKFKLEKEDVNKISSLISEIILNRYINHNPKKVVEPEVQEKLQLKLASIIQLNEGDAHQRSRKVCILRALSWKINNNNCEEDIRVGDIVQLCGVRGIRNFGEKSIDLIEGIVSGLGLKFGMNIERNKDNNLYYYRER